MNKTNHHINVLIVEDERLAAEDLSIRLKQHNCEIVGIAGTGKEAVELAAAKNPDIIVMDIQLRGNMDGIETARLIHEHQAVPVIFATAYGDDAHISQALGDADPYGFLHKPVDDQAAHTMMRIALSRFTSDQLILRINELRLLKDIILNGIQPSLTLPEILNHLDNSLSQSKIFDCFWVLLWAGGNRQLSAIKSSSLDKEVFKKYCDQMAQFTFVDQTPIMPDMIMNSILKKNTFYAPVIVEGEVVGLFGYKWGFEAQEYSREEIVIADIAQFFSQRIINLRLKDEKRKTQLQADEAEAHIKAIVEQSTTGIYLINHDYKFEYVNEKFCKIFGRSESELLGSYFYEYIGSMKDKVVEYYEARQRGENPPSEYEIDIILPNGEIRDLLVSANAYTDSSGTVKNTGHVLDVTEQNTANVDLRKLSQAVDQSPIMTIITNVSGNIEYVNSQFSSIMGYSAEEVIGQNPRVFNSGKHTTGFYKDLWDTITAGTIWNGEIINRKKDGDLVWGKLSIAPIRDLEDKITHFVALSEDISRQKVEDEKALRDQKLKDVLYAITSASIQAKDVSKLYEKIYQYISDIISTSNFFMALLDKETNTIYFPFERDYYVTDMPESIFCDPESSLTARTIVSGEPLHLGADEIRSVIGDGQVTLAGDIPSVWLGIPLKVKDEVIGAFVLQEYNGITKYEAEDVRLLELAAGQVALTIERARKEKALRELAEQLASANGMKELLLDVITHDLRNPAGVISSITEMLESEDSGNELFEVLRGSSDSLLQVIESATVLSKLSIGEKIGREEFDLVPTLKEIVKEFNSQLATANMKINLHLPSTQMVLANPIISEIPKNYISNAIKYASEGSIIDVILTLDDEDRVVLRIEDYGTPIPVKQRDAIFERSVQLAKGEKKGRGLGLAIVKRIAESHEAEVGVEISKHGGNSFFIKF
ncbi:MAG: PAS domain S-box protein [Candidatus Marinimicrobia bacterium]|nr:PAS domain S-box protein [Candidatus Neomarinimicrobiota bacterium]